VKQISRLDLIQFTLCTSGHRLAGLAAICCELGRLQDAFKFASEGLLVHKAAAAPSTSAIENCESLLRLIQQSWFVQ
jgi:hypothetical protein